MWPSWTGYWRADERGSLQSNKLAEYEVSFEEPPEAREFNIDLVFTENAFFDRRQRLVIELAAQRWQEVIVGDITNRFYSTESAVLWGAGGLGPPWEKGGFFPGRDFRGYSTPMASGGRRGRNSTPSTALLWTSTPIDHLPTNVGWTGNTRFRQDGHDGLLFIR